LHGLWRYQKGVFTRVFSDPVRQIVEDPLAGVWVLAGSLYHCSGEECMPEPIPANAGLGSLSVIIPFGGGFWVADLLGQARFIRDGRIVLSWNTPVLEADALLPVSEGEVWMGGRNGLWRCTGKGECARQTFRSTEADLRVSALLRDHEESLWIGTWGSGLYQQPPRAFSIFDLESGLPSSTVWSFAEDRQGCTWMATNSAGVVPWCEGRWGRPLTTSDGLPSDRIVSLLSDAGDGLWIGTDRGIAFENAATRRVKTWDARSGAPQGSVEALALDSKGNLWGGTDRGLVRYAEGAWSSIGPEEGFPGSQVRALAVDKAGILWAATRDAGLVRCEGSSFRMFGTRDGLPSERVWCVLADSHNRIWAGTARGLWIHPLDGGPDRVVGDPAVLPSLNIMFVTEDAEGMFWAGTTSGVARLTPEGRVVKVFTAVSGFSDSEAAENAAFLDGKGRLWFGMANGVTRVDSTRIGRNFAAPPLVLERIVVNGEPLRTGLPRSNRVERPDAELELPSGVRELRFEFSALSFIAPDQIKYRCMLEGLDAEPGKPFEENFIAYHNLAPGEYRFRLEACNNDGMWVPQPLEIPFTLRPALYQTWAFRGGAGLGFLGVLAGIYGIRSAAQRRLRRRLETEVAERTAALSDANRKLEELSRTDPLTQLANRRVLEEQLPLEVSIQHRELERLQPETLESHFGMALLMLDLDNFKDINDRYGHDAGDEVLRRAAERMHHTLREIDLCVRWGGEEFVILCRRVNRPGLMEVSRRLLAALCVPVTVGTDEIPLAVSLGFMAYPVSAGSHLPPREWPALVQTADQLMYLAKQRGEARACGIVGSARGVPRMPEHDLLEALAADPARPPSGLELVEIQLGVRPLETGPRGGIPKAGPPKKEMLDR
jgi:diguanylate cyclase (GGDEF)-like protein